MNKNGVLWGGFEKDSQHVYRISSIEKTSSTYKIGVLGTLLKAMFTVCLQKTYLADDPLT